MDSKLYRAVVKDDINVLMKIEGRLKVGDQRTATNNTVLHLASQYGSKKCVEEILSVHESLLLEINSRGETALHQAAREGHYDVVVLLLNAAKPSVPQPSHIQNALVNVTEKETHQALQPTCTDEIICDPAPVDVAGPSSSQKEVITNTASRLNFLIRSTDLEGETALHLAARYNRYRVVQLLVQKDQDHIYPPNRCHETPLYVASIRHYNDIISTILHNCKSPTFGGPEGKTALHAAVMFERGRECVKLLLSKGNTNLVEVQDDNGWTAFHVVAYNKLYEIIEVLVDAEADAGNKSAGYKLDKEKRTAFHIAARVGAVGVMDELLKYYPDSWEMVDGMGRNVLHIAVEEKDKWLIIFILSQGSTTGNSLFSQRDHKGNTPLHLIAKFAYFVPEIMNQGKLDWEVDWKVTDYDNRTPLDILQYRQDTDTLAHTVMVNTIRWKLIYKKVANFSNRGVRRSISNLEHDLETGNRLAKHNDKLNMEYLNKFKEAVNTHMIVAALIASVALTAGLAVPGGFVEGKGYPQLLTKAAFQLFMIADAITVLFSIASLLLYFVSTMSIFSRTLGSGKGDKEWTDRRLKRK
ncbi:uncharacterized protein LOC141714195 [Apium graveolens]|uniref:uncharacterized protein LOC141714195 n=1 Tax=Apium graveolens TaxID=4045 RepID=UPI003D7BDD52